jgi:hypothetical protein
VAPPPPQYVCNPPSHPKNCRAWFDIAMGKWHAEMLRQGYAEQMIFAVKMAALKGTSK